MANGRARAGVTRRARGDVALVASAREGAEAVHGRRGVMAGEARRRAIMALDQRGARVRLVARVFGAGGGAGGVLGQRGERTRGNMALVETEDARREREAREKEEADAAARAENAPPPPHPMLHPDFQQYMRAMEEDRRRYQESQSKNMQDFFTQVINDKGNEGKGVTLSDFQNARPLPFTSAPEPMDAEDWLMDTERKLKTVGCNDEEKIRYTTYLLSGPAASWWENLVAVHPPDKVFTWEEFKKKFRDAHVPESVVELKKREFDELRQNTAPIMQYVRDFNRLSRYAPEEVDTEEKRKKWFMKGMNPYMKMQLRLARTAEFQELIDSAITFEDDYRQVQEDRRKRARIEPRKYPISKPTPDRSFKPRFRPTTGNQYNRGGQNQNPINQII
ncbi:hypothetical protein QYE76_047382 [Lolium multiflorum]|uniref:Retrotransposon gag domain-containing protein n=1 Tax=Lolium multiflorum TaxID=4521 RepID=A0AAD8TRM5_LOLMU|nr:hypothetical protein QYE76_047382 [Lolium multiflorum]